MDLLKMLRVIYHVIPLIISHVIPLIADNSGFEKNLEVCIILARMGWIESEAYLKSSRTSTMELFSKNGLTAFAKKLYGRCLTGF